MNSAFSPSNSVFLAQVPNSVKGWRRSPFAEIPPRTTRLVSFAFQRCTPDSLVNGKNPPQFDRNPLPGYVPDALDVGPTEFEE